MEIWKKHSEQQSKAKLKQIFFISSFNAIK